MVTNEIGFAQNSATRVIFMDNGRTIPKNKALQVTKARVLFALFCRIIFFWPYLYDSRSKCSFINHRC